MGCEHRHKPILWSLRPRARVARLLCGACLAMLGCAPCANRLPGAASPASCWSRLGESQDLDDTVRGNRRAEAEARVSRVYLDLGYAGVVGGAGLAWVGGLAAAPLEPHGKVTQAAGAVLVGHGIGMLGAAAVLLWQARVHAARSAAIYNARGAGGDR
jgi:hypothetical protein